MKNFITMIRNAVWKRAAYVRTVTELSQLPIDIQIDLGIYQGDVRRIARTAVYGA